MALRLRRRASCDADLANSYCAVVITVLRRRYCQIFGPSRHFPKLSDCRHLDVSIHLDWHLRRQATESCVKRSTALWLISHGSSPYPNYRLPRAAYNLSTLLAIGQGRVCIQFDAIRRPLWHLVAIMRRTCLNSEQSSSAFDAQIDLVAKRHKIDGLGQ